MANFDIAYSKIDKQEGGLNLKQSDRKTAGITYAGLTTVYDKDFFATKMSNGLTVLEFINYKIVQAGGEVNVKEETKFIELAPYVKSYYKAKYWIACKGDLIDNQDMANFVFSFVVNSGQGAKQTNVAINIALGKKVVTENNAITTDTVKYINSHPTPIYNQLYPHRLNYLKSLSTWNLYKNGWLRMMALFPTKLLDEKKK